jgi:hypothetical protein
VTIGGGWRVEAAVGRKTVGVLVDTKRVVRIEDGDGFGMLVLRVMFLGVYFFVLLEILWSLELFLADLACMWLEWRMDT